MTVAIGLVCSDGVIVASDGMASSGNTARAVCKVYAQPDLSLVWTASGSVYVIEEVEQVLANLVQDKKIAACCRAPGDGTNLTAIRHGFGDAIRTKMGECYGAALPFGVQQIVANNGHPFQTDFLLLGWARGTPWFLEISSDGQLNWHTSHSFYAVGSGGEFASVAQGLMDHFLEGPSVTVEDGLLLAYRTIATTIATSSHHVGLPVWLAVATDKGARVLERDDVEKVSTTVDGWKLVEKETFLSLRAKPAEAGVNELPAAVDDIAITSI